MLIEELGKAPRPNMYRDKWILLDGPWEFEFDDRDEGVEMQWYAEKSRPFSKTITVPYCFQSEKSGIHDLGRHEVVWYRKTIDVPSYQEHEQLWINFGAVDYKATVWIDGQYALEHIGGSTPFSVKVPRRCLKQGSFTLVLRAEDSYSCEQPRGKQFWGVQPERCWYTPTTGIWQHVWMEVTGEAKLEKVLVTPDVDRHLAGIAVNFSDSVEQGVLSWQLYLQDRQVKSGTQSVHGREVNFAVSVEDEDPIDNTVHLWSPSNPTLYVLVLELSQNGQVIDRVTTYFGMRKIEIHDGEILLNHFPLYQKLVLDQGYWPDTLMTPPSDEALLQDVLLAQKMGFNGVRKHQKIEDPKFYYYADVHGLLVWNEMPSMYRFSNASMAALMREWQEVLERDYNHPSIITLVPLNESWGVRDIVHDERQQQFAVSLYHLTKAIDSTRLVSTNDGWETVTSDMCGIHDYEKSGDNLLVRYEDKERLLASEAVGKRIYANGYAYGNEPVLLSEFGGIAIQDGQEQSWGYHDKAANAGELLERMEGLVDAIHKLDYIQGYCYTQLTDVEQETNGLLHPDRTPKADLDRIRSIITRG